MHLQCGEDWLESLTILFFWWWLGGGGGEEEGDETLPDGGQSGIAGTPSSPGQPANLRRRVARAQNRHRLVNKPQDFQVSMMMSSLLPNQPLKATMSTC